LNVAGTDAAKQLPRLGAGWQYHAYDLGDGRVLKVPISRSALIHIALERRRNDPAYSPEQATAWAAAVVSGVQRSYRVLENVLPHLDARLLGNPELLGHGVYEQDKLLMIGDYISHHTFPENAAIIDRYVDTTLELWQWGISEDVFNFTVNSGIGRDDGVVLCDLGDITASKTTVQRMVSNQVWLNRYSYNTLPDVRLKEYVRARLAEQLTPARVEMTWGTLRRDR
jgi:hypothetical protein